jgi:hypothetical protein
MSGYTKLASFMAEKDHTLIRKYQHLAVRDLLYLQAEICQLESEYELVAKRDSTASDDRRYYDRDWFQLESSQRRDLGGEQWRLALDIRLKLREYCSCMLYMSGSSA